MPLAVRVRREGKYIRIAIVADHAQLIRAKALRTLPRESKLVFKGEFIVECDSR